MTIESVRAHLAEKAPELQIIESHLSTATVALAAVAHGVEPGQIAKTLSLRIGDRVFLLVTRGDFRLDNKKAKAAFGAKPSMLSHDDVVAVTSHPVGGVCPFGLPQRLPIYCDISLKTFEDVYPAAGSINSSVRVGPQRLADLVGATWVDACVAPQP